MWELSMVLFTFGQINPNVSHKKSIKLVKNYNLCPYWVYNFSTFYTNLGLSWGRSSYCSSPWRCWQSQHTALWQRHTAFTLCAHLQICAEMGSQELYALHGFSFLQHLISSALYTLLTFVFSIIFSEHDGKMPCRKPLKLALTCPTAKGYIRTLNTIWNVAD